MNRSRIEWCDHTWNPITGCRHNCQYCYARKMTARFSGDVRLNKMAEKDYHTAPAADGGEDLYVLDSPMFNETGNMLAYPFGFAPTLHRHRMDFIGKLKMGNNIFVGAMADIFGTWVPDEWIYEIFKVCLSYPVHNYLFLTKNPERYERMESSGMLPAGKNMWYGSTLTKPEDKCFISNMHHTFWSIEPMHAPFRLWEKDEFSPDWIIIGAETGNRKGKIVPEREWIADIVSLCNAAGIPVFMKDSLAPIIGEENMRRELPEQLKHPELSPKIKNKIYGSCSICGVSLKKREMVALSAKTGRGYHPKQFAFMCNGCFTKSCEKLGLDVPGLDGGQDA